MLINRNDLDRDKPEEDHQFTKVLRTKGKNRSLLSPKTCTLDKLIGSIERNETIHILTRSTWSTPHLMDYLVDQIGPAEGYVTSWSIKEQSVRILLGMIDEKRLKGLHGLFDERIRVNCPQAAQLVESEVSDIRLTKIHAKLTVLINDDWAIGISSSANLTRNPRIESYVISTHRDIAEFYRDTIMGEIQKANPFEL